MNILKESELQETDFGSSLVPDPSSSPCKRNLTTHKDSSSSPGTGPPFQTELDETDVGRGLRRERSRIRFVHVVLRLKRHLSLYRTINVLTVLNIHQPTITKIEESK